MKKKRLAEGKIKMRCKVCGKFYLFSHRCEKIREQYISDVNRYNKRSNNSDDMLDPTNVILTAALLNSSSSNHPQEQEQKIEESVVTSPCDKDACSFDSEPVKTESSVNSESNFNLEPSFNSEPSFSHEPSFDSSPDFGSSDCGSCDSGGGFGD